MRIIVIHWIMQTTLLYSSAENSHTVPDLQEETLSTVHKWCAGLSYQPTKDGDSTIHKEERFKGTKGTSTLWTHSS
jgi:hypothetical protein